MRAGFVKVATNLVVAFIAGFGAALASGATVKTALAAGAGAVVAILTGLFQEKPNSGAA